MKYLLGNTVINSDNIVKVVYLPATPDDPDPKERLSVCGIETVNTASDMQDGDNHGWSVWLRGERADRFWEAYTGDAYQVFAEKNA